MESLSNLYIDEEGIVRKIDVVGSIKRRLLDIGIIPGTRIKCLFSSPFNDPKAYLIRGIVVALREEETKNIMVEKLGDMDVIL